MSDLLVLQVAIERTGIAPAALALQAFSLSLVLDTNTQLGASYGLQYKS